MQFTAKNGEIFELRPTAEGDAAACMDFINSLVEEKAFVRINKKMTLAEEQKWAVDRVKNAASGKSVESLVLKGDVVVANGEVTRIGGNQNHIGILGISVRKGFRGLGIGLRLGEELIARARQAGMEILSLEVVAENAPAVALYKKLGFVPGAVLSKEFKLDGKYHNSILMRLSLPKPAGGGTA